jgi:hypothetical protein
MFAEDLLTAKLGELVGGVFSELADLRDQGLYKWGAHGLRGEPPTAGQRPSSSVAAAPCTKTGSGNELGDQTVCVGGRKTCTPLPARRTFSAGRGSSAPLNSWKRTSPSRAKAARWQGQSSRPSAWFARKMHP